MAQQLIVTILGADKTGILSEIATLVANNNCNILDSRQAVYGQEFSFTMILEGNQGAISRLECSLPLFCQQHDLLSMLKRTRQHEKQNIERVIGVEFSGTDAAGLMKEITGFFASRNASIGAFRQKTFENEHTGAADMRCKIMVNVPIDLDITQLEHDLMILMGQLDLQGKLIDNQKDNNEYSSSWQ